MSTRENAGSSSSTSLRIAAPSDQDANSRWCLEDVAANRQRLARLPEGPNKSLWRGGTRRVSALFSQFGIDGGFTTRGRFIRFERVCASGPPRSMQQLFGREPVAAAEELSTVPGVQTFDVLDHHTRSPFGNQGLRRLVIEILNGMTAEPIQGAVCTTRQSKGGSEHADRITQEVPQTRRSEWSGPFPLLGMPRCSLLRCIPG
jgi:hypothetical protein